MRKVRLTYFSVIYYSFVHGKSTISLLIILYNELNSIIGILQYGCKSNHYLHTIRIELQNRWLPVVISV